MAIPRYRCEMCNEIRLCSKDDTVCQKCDYELMKADKTYFAALKKTQKKRKCRACGRICEPNRYFNCMACIPDPAMPMEDFHVEKTDNMDGVQSISHILVKRRALARPQFDSCDSKRDTKVRE